MFTTSLKIRKNIRISIRILRKSLTLEERYIESIKISKVAFKCNLISGAKNIAIFLPFDGEINTYPLILKLWLNKIQVFLPVIHSLHKKKMLFVRFTYHSILHLNQYNILEPVFNTEDIISISNLDIVITPLVAFDKVGSRLGMGGGFYDYFLKNWNQKKFLPIGFAYNFQLVNLIPKQHWDIPLPVVFTPDKIWRF